jgi:hypothetical protein
VLQPGGIYCEPYFPFNVAAILLCAPFGPQGKHDDTGSTVGFVAADAFVADRGHISLVAEGADGLNAGGAVRGHDRGEDADSDEKYGDGGEGERVGGAHAED